MSADIDDIHSKLSEGGLIDATEAIIYAQYHTNELRRTVDSLRGIAALSVADEREACARIVENSTYPCSLQTIAAKIRARGA